MQVLTCKQNAGSHGVTDFEDLSKAISCRVCEVAAIAGWMRVGADHDTAEFAVEALRRRWREMGRHAYPQAVKLLVTRERFGSNSRRGRLW